MPSGISCAVARSAGCTVPSCPARRRGALGRVSPARPRGLARRRAADRRATGTSAPPVAVSETRAASGGRAGVPSPSAGRPGAATRRAATCSCSRAAVPEEPPVRSSPVAPAARGGTVSRRATVPSGPAVPRARPPRHVATVHPEGHRLAGHEPAAGHRDRPARADRVARRPVGAGGAVGDHRRGPGAGRRVRRLPPAVGGLARTPRIRGDGAVGLGGPGERPVVELVDPDGTGAVGGGGDQPAVDRLPRCDVPAVQDAGGPGRQVGGVLAVGGAGGGEDDVDGDRAGPHLELQPARLAARPPGDGGLRPGRVLGGGAPGLR